MVYYIIYHISDQWMVARLLPESLRKYENQSCQPEFEGANYSILLLLLLLYVYIYMYITITITITITIYYYYYYYYYYYHESENRSRQPELRAPNAMS